MFFLVGLSLCEKRLLGPGIVLRADVLIFSRKKNGLFPFLPRTYARLKRAEVAFFPIWVVVSFSPFWLDGEVACGPFVPPLPEQRA